MTQPRDIVERLRSTFDYPARSELVAMSAEAANAIIALRQRVAELEAALRVPYVWSEAERDGMATAFAKANGKHGHYETLFAVAAWLLRHRAAMLA